jgi:hypothetical protein|tara:strand:- start:593 stop:775 length:183 start_codon:yes stop_codon:yes gene_type:complete
VCAVLCACRGGKAWPAVLLAKDCRPDNRHGAGAGTKHVYAAIRPLAMNNLENHATDGKLR